MGFAATAPGNFSGNPERFTIRELRPEEAASCAGLTFPSMTPKLAEVSDKGPHLALAAARGDEIVGLIYGEIEADTTGHVRSVFVRAAHRGQRIAGALLAHLERQFTQLGCQQAKIAWMTGRASTEVLERLLHSAGWDEPVSQTLICRTDERMLTWSRYGTKTMRVDEEFTLLPWVDISDYDRESIRRRQAEEPWIPEDLIPFQYESNLEPINSLAVRHEGEIIGWMITHRVAPDTIRYTCSFMHPRLQGRFRIAPIYQQAYAIQHAAGVPIAIWMVPFQHRAMVNFVKRRWGQEGVVTHTESRISSKKLVDVGRAE